MRRKGLCLSANEIQPFQQHFIISRVNMADQEGSHRKVIENRAFLSKIARKLD